MIEFRQYDKIKFQFCMHFFIMCIFVLLFSCAIINYVPMLLNNGSQRGSQYGVNMGANVGGNVSLICEIRLL